MGEAAALEGFWVNVSDVTGQRSATERALSDATVGELTASLVRKLALGSRDASGQPQVYQARLEREARQLNASEIVGEALEEGDHIVVAPATLAG